MMATTAGMRCYEAAEYTLGGQADSAEWKEKLTRKEMECEQWEKDYKDVSAALQEQMQKASGDPQELDAETGKENLLEHLGRSPQVHALGAFAVIGIRLWFYAAYQATRTGTLGSDCLMVVVTFALIFGAGIPLFNFLGLTYQNSGLGPVVIKALGTLVGLYVTLGNFLGGMNPHEWWFTPHLQPALVALGITAIFAVSNASEKASRLLGTSERSTFAALRSWFI